MELKSRLIANWKYDGKYDFFYIICLCLHIVMLCFLFCLSRVSCLVCPTLPVFGLSILEYAFSNVYVISRFIFSISNFTCFSIWLLNFIKKIQMILLPFEISAYSNGSHLGSFYLKFLSSRFYGDVFFSKYAKSV
jgi:hypothetical protein